MKIGIHFALEMPDFDVGRHDFNRQFRSSTNDSLVTVKPLDAENANVGNEYVQLANLGADFNESVQGELGVGIEISD